MLKSITISNDYFDPVTLELSHSTLIYGLNGSGKTLLIKSLKDVCLSRTADRDGSCFWPCAFNTRYDLSWIIDGQTNSVSNDTPVSSVELVDTIKFFDDKIDYDAVTECKDKVVSLLKVMDKSICAIDVTNIVRSIGGSLHFWPISNECSGIKRMLALSPHIIRAYENDEILVVDNIDASFHPIVVKHLMQSFSSAKGQLLATACSSSLTQSDYPTQYYIERQDLKSAVYSVDVLVEKFKAKIG